MSQGERLVGRDAALAVLRDALDGAPRGRGGVALLAGEAGIGKTALAAALAGQAAGEGAWVLWGQCWQGEAVPAYWPWVQVLRAAAEASPAAELGDAARLLPGADAGAEPVAGPGEDPEAARFRVFDAVVGVLAGLAARQPLLVVLDDLHWADEASLRLQSAQPARDGGPPPAATVLAGVRDTLERRLARLSQPCATCWRWPRWPGPRSAWSCWPGCCPTAAPAWPTCWRRRSGPGC